MEHAVRVGGAAQAWADEARACWLAGLENLEPEHVEILLRVLHAAAVEGDEGDEDAGVREAAPYQLYQLAANSNAPLPESFTQNADRWLKVLRKIELHVYVALADDELCDNIVIVSCRRRAWRSCLASLLACHGELDLTRERRRVQVLTKWIRALGDRAFLTFGTLNKSLKLIFASEPSPEACQNAAVSLLMVTCLYTTIPPPQDPLRAAAPAQGATALRDEWRSRPRDPT